MYHFHHISIKHQENKFIYKYDYSSYVEDDIDFDLSLNRLLHTEGSDYYKIDDDIIMNWWNSLIHFDSNPNKKVLLLISPNELKEPFKIYNFEFD